MYGSGLTNGDGVVAVDVDVEVVDKIALEDADIENASAAMSASITDSNSSGQTSTDTEAGDDDVIPAFFFAVVVVVIVHFFCIAAFNISTFLAASAAAFDNVFLTFAEVEVIARCLSRAAFALSLSRSSTSKESCCILSLSRTTERGMCGRQVVSAGGVGVEVIIVAGRLRTTGTVTSQNARSARAFSRCSASIAPSTSVCDTVNRQTGNMVRTTR